MNNDKIQAYKDSLTAKAKEQERQQEIKESINATKESANAVIGAIAGESQRTRQHTQKVKSVDPLASPEDIKKVADGLDELLVSQTITADDLTEKFKDISAGLLVLADEISSLPKDKIEFPEFPEQKEEMKVTNFAELSEYFVDVVAAVNNLKQDIKFDPTIEVAPADVKVEATDMKPVINGLAKLEKAIAKIQIPEYDNTTLLEATENVSRAINGLEFPIPNYVLPYKNTDGAATQVTLDSEGAVPISSTDDGTVSTVNSTTAPLTAGSTFTGEWEDVARYSSVILAVKTDQNGTFTVQFSPDGTNADSTLTRYYRTGQIEAPHNFSITRQYMRVTFTNTSSSDQTFMRFQTLLGSHPELNAPIDSTLAADFDAIAVRPTDYRYEVALGRRQGASLWNKFGYNADVDVGTEVIASFGGTFTPLTTATTLTVVSTDAADDDGGTGCNSIVVYGIDANRDEQIEVVTMNGTTNVVTTSTWLGINRVAMFLCGSGKVNAGTINITATTGGSTMAQMPAAGGVTQQCIFHVPQNQQFIMEYLRVNTLKQAAQDPVVTVKVWVYSAVSNGKQEVYRVSLDTAVTNDITENPNLSFPVSEKTVVWLEATTDKADTIVNARFSGILIKDVDA